jgi:hypothetical protein
VTGRRTSEAVVFRWSTPDGVQGGDTWEWRRTDTGEQRRTDATTVTLKTQARICLQVRLIRGSFPSPWGNKCVG